ncbi:MAG TPA: hypothetical protein VEC36_13410, partial [Patescibacteria group bacterium]|nr:hypothetical protein [Patescibacteria group bacterium]
GYAVYRSSATGKDLKPVNFERIAIIEKGQTVEDTAFVDKDVVHHQRYFYKVAAFERSGQKREGEFSPAAEFTLTGYLKTIAPVNGAEFAQTEEPVFSWENSYSTPGYTVIRVFEINPVNNVLTTPVWIFSGQPAFSSPSFRYNEDGKAATLEKGKAYRWYVSQIVPGQGNRAAVSSMQNFIVK